MPNQSERILDHAREQLRKRFGNIDVFSGVGDPSREILKTAETVKADLIR